MLPKNEFLQKWWILTPLQKLPKNVGENNCCQSFKSGPKSNKSPDLVTLLVRERERACVNVCMLCATLLCITDEGGSRAREREREREREESVTAAVFSRAPMQSPFLYFYLCRPHCAAVSYSWAPTPSLLSTLEEITYLLPLLPIGFETWGATQACAAVDNDDDTKKEKNVLFFIFTGFYVAPKIKSSLFCYKKRKSIALKISTTVLSNNKQKAVFLNANSRPETFQQFALINDRLNTNWNRTTRVYWQKIQ